jgi:hypothetical protein
MDAFRHQYMLKQPPEVDIGYRLGLRHLLG